MINNSIEKGIQAKKEGNSNNESNFTKGSSSSRQWSGLKDPRVVRVSRTFGGKDRHSKVCTVRGLRDRRVRLSVPTAIQLYDLQDRLGLNQPSKVVDWLLNAAKHEIDELPPLQIPPGAFGQYQPSSVVPHDDNELQSSLASLIDANLGYAKEVRSDSLASSKGGININDNNPSRDDQGTSFTYWNLNFPSKSKGAEIEVETMNDKSSWIKRNEQDQETQRDVEVHSAQVSSHNSLPRPGFSNSTFPGLLNNAIPSYYHWDPSNLSLSHLGNHGYSIQMEDPHNPNAVSMASPLSFPLLCPTGTTPSFFSPYVTTQVECNTRQINNHLQMLGSSSQNVFANPLAPSPFSLSQPIRPLQLSISPKHPSQNNNAGQSNKGSSDPF